MILIGDMSGKAEQNLMRERVFLKPKGVLLSNAKRIMLYTKKNCAAGCKYVNILLFLLDSANLSYYDQNIPYTDTLLRL